MQPWLSACYACTSPQYQNCSITKFVYFTALEMEFLAYIFKTVIHLLALMSVSYYKNGMEEGPRLPCMHQTPKLACTSDIKTN